jgi:hypothetical protein
MVDELETCNFEDVCGFAYRVGTTQFDGDEGWRVFDSIHASRPGCSVNLDLKMEPKNSKG